MNRFYFKVETTAQWYGIIAECTRMFGKNWSGKKKVKKAIEQYTRGQRGPVPEVWFDVPSDSFGTFIAIKFGLQVETKNNA